MDRQRIATVWVVVVVMAMGGGLAPGPAQAQEAAPVQENAAPALPTWLSQVALNGFASFAYTHNFNSPSSGTNALRVFDFDEGTYSLDVAEVVVQKPAAAPGETGFRIDLAAGMAVPRISAASGLFRDEETGEAEDFDLQQAFASWVAPVGRGLRLDFGKFTTIAGAEVIEGYDGFNDNYSRSFLFGYAQPATHTGVRASYPFSDKVSATFLCVNGWDNARDNNDEKTLGAQIVVTPSSAFALYVNVLTGDEQTHGSGRRDLADIVAVIKPTSKLTLMLNYDEAREEHLGADGGDASWRGLAAYVRADFSDHCALALRGEWFDDEDGARTGTAQELTGLTLTPIFKINERFTLRFDLRADMSDEDVFDDDGHPDDRQTTAAMNVVYAF